MKYHFFIALVAVLLSPPAVADGNEDSIADIESWLYDNMVIDGAVQEYSEKLPFAVRKIIENRLSCRKEDDPYSPSHQHFKLSEILVETLHTHYIPMPELVDNRFFTYQSCMHHNCGAKGMIVADITNKEIGFGLIDKGNWNKGKTGRWDIREEGDWHYLFLFVNPDASAHFIEKTSELVNEWADQKRVPLVKDKKKNPYSYSYEIKPLSVVKERCPEE